MTHQRRLRLPCGWTSRQPSRALVVNGGTYNPFMAPPERAQVGKEKPADAGKPQALPRAALLPDATPAQPDMHARRLSHDYIPPENLPPMPESPAERTGLFYRGHGGLDR